MNEIVTVTMREMLFEHLDGVKVPFVLPWALHGLEAAEAARRLQTINALISRKFIRFGVSSKQYTVITALGRQVLGKLLADYADALVRYYQMTPNPSRETRESFAAMALFSKSLKEIETV